MSRPGRRVVLVSGAPGSGKTSLAAPLAAELGFALLGKDLITVDTTGPVDVAALAGRVRGFWEIPA